MQLSLVLFYAGTMQSETLTTLMSVVFKGETGKVLPGS